LEVWEKAINEFLNKTKVSIEKRDNYNALVLKDESGRLIDTLVSGVSEQEIKRILDVLCLVLSWEKKLLK